MKGDDGWNLPPSEGQAKGYYTTVGNAGDGVALCLDGVKNDCGSYTNAYYSMFKITKGNDIYEIKAYSAYRGGKGAVRGQNFEETDEYGPMLTEDNEPIYNTPRANGLGDINGADGKCVYNGAIQDSDSVCGENISGSYGYCLKRWYYGYGDADKDGGYLYRHSYDENYLQYGNPGAAGEYKTMVVRSLKDIDTTIKIGRGGAAGASGSGASGFDGSPTSMGKLIYAEGGKGGLGGIIGKTAVLPRYDESSYQDEELCFNKAKYCDSNNSSYNIEKCKAVSDLEKEEDAEGNPQTCGVRFPTYEYHMVTGQLAGGKPMLKGLASNLLSYILPKVVDAITEEFMKSGHGGTGGGVTHNCWAGQWIIDFEDTIRRSIKLSKSVYPGSSFRMPESNTSDPSVPTPAGAKTVPESCYSDFGITPAGDGVDGALMIKW